jgi:hypothetical protein
MGYVRRTNHPLWVFIRKYNENHIDGSPELKRRSTRHVSEIITIAREYGNSTKIIVPRSWLRKRVIAFLHSEYTAKHPEERRRADEY